jgi:hypothetical protein
VSQLVHQETCSFKFTYNGYAQKRTIQKWPVVVKKFFAKVDPVTFNNSGVAMRSGIITVNNGKEYNKISIDKYN